MKKTVLGGPDRRFGRRRLAGDVDLVNAVLEGFQVILRLGRVNGRISQFLQVWHKTMRVKGDHGGGLGDFVDGEVVFAAGTDAFEMVEGQA